MWSNDIELKSEKYSQFEPISSEISTILQNAGIEKLRDSHLQGYENRGWKRRDTKTKGLGNAGMKMQVLASKG